MTGAKHYENILNFVKVVSKYCGLFVGHSVFSMRSL